jgi:hypothetical protein
MPNADVEPPGLSSDCRTPVAPRQEWYEKELERQLASIRASVAAQAGMIAQFNAQLPAAVRAAVEHRRGELEKGQALTAAFKFPL